MTVMLVDLKKGSECSPPSVQVKELGRHRKEAALYHLIFSDGHEVWRITKPISEPSEIPSSLWPEFTNELNARQSFGRLVGWVLITNKQPSEAA